MQKLLTIRLVVNIKKEQGLVLLLPLLERLKITHRQLLAKLNGKTEVAPTPKLSPKYVGKLPVKVSEAMQKHIAESRSE